MSRIHQLVWPLERRERPGDTGDLEHLGGDRAGIPRDSLRYATRPWTGPADREVCVRHQVQRLFTITGLDRQIPLARTVTEGCQNLAAAGEIRVTHRQHVAREGSGAPRVTRSS
jgi:hypothetical protein